MTCASVTDLRLVGAIVLHLARDGRHLVAETRPGAPGLVHSARLLSLWGSGLLVSLAITPIT